MGKVGSEAIAARQHPAPSVEAETSKVVVPSGEVIVAAKLNCLGGANREQGYIIPYINIA